MRIFLVLILVGLVSGAGLGWWPEAERESEDMTEALRLKAEAALGIRRMLRSHSDFDFRDVVVGRVLEGGQVDFRGQVQRGARMEAVYGLVNGQCADGLAEANCWDLVHLEANGTEVALAEQRNNPTTPAAHGNLETTRNVPSEPIETADVKYLSRETVQPLETSPSATHKVARPVINTRSGPGTDNPVLTRLNAGARLSLIETQGGWGNFVILDGRAGGQEVWAALSLLEEAQQ